MNVLRAFRTLQQESGGVICEAWQTEGVNDYERIARIIRYVEKHQRDQPELAELAAHAGLSPFHLHRLFSAWAGVTPKDFLQCLTLLRCEVVVLINGDDPAERTADMVQALFDHRQVDLESRHT